MENIGQILKERREELNYSLKDMENKTKLSLVQLQAIERGDIQFFKDDLSYLSYFVRYYANALGIDYNEIRNQLDDSIMAFTDSVSLSKIKKQEELNARVLKQAKKGTRARKKIDFSSIALIAVLLVVGVLFVFAWQKYIWPSLQSKDPIEPPVIVVPDDEDPDKKPDENPVEPPDETPIESTVVVKAVDPYTYEITGWQEDEELVFDFAFKNRSWVRFSEDGAILDAPAQGIYETGENAKVILKAKSNKVLSANIGYLNGNTVSLNEKIIELEPEAAESKSGLVLEFKLVEGETEE